LFCAAPQKTRFLRVAVTGCHIRGIRKNFGKADKNLLLPGPGHFGLKANPVTPPGQFTFGLDVIAVNEPGTFMGIAAVLLNHRVLHRYYKAPSIMEKRPLLRHWPSRNTM